MVYLFVGDDEFSKDIKLNKIKQEFFSPRLEQFNFEILHSDSLDLKTLQERLLALPVKAKQRLILIRDAAGLSKDIKQYLLVFLKKPSAHVSLILDARQIDARDQFFKKLSRLAKLINFHQSSKINSFSLARAISQKRVKPAMRLLSALLLQGERPEMILGAIRYQLERERLNLVERKKRLLFLLNCDIDIKTGRLKPNFALERLLISLCCF